MKRHKQNRGHYDLIACGGSLAYARKETLICPKCGYTSRVRLGFQDNKDANASYTCPKHNIELQSLGTITRVPKRGSNKHKKFMKSSKKLK